MEGATNSSEVISKDMNTLLTCRDLLKGSIERMMKFSQNPPETTTSEQISARLSHLEAVWKEYTRCTGALYEFKTHANFVNPEEELSASEEMYLNTQCLLKALLPKLSNNTNVIVEQQSDIIKQLTERLMKLESSSSSGDSRSPPKIDDDLPNIVVAPFSGNYKEWPPFEDLFKSALESKPNWTNKQKFDYLKSLLRGDAANLIKQMRLSDESFSAAWDRLKKQYDRPLYVVHSYIETFMTLPTMSNGTGSELRKIYNGASGIIRSLDAMGQSERDPWLIYILMSKLDGQTSRKWTEQSCDDPKPTITTFLNFLDQYCQELGNGDEYYTKTTTANAATRNMRRTATTKTGKNRHPYNSSRNLQSADECTSLPEIQSPYNHKQYKGYNNQRPRYNPKMKHANPLNADPSTGTKTTREEESSKGPNEFNSNQKPLVELSTNCPQSQRTTMPSQFGQQQLMTTFIPSTATKTTREEESSKDPNEFNSNQKPLVELSTNCPQSQRTTMPSQFGQQQLMTTFIPSTATQSWNQRPFTGIFNNDYLSQRIMPQFRHQQPIFTYNSQHISQRNMPSRCGQQQHMPAYNSQQISSRENMQKVVPSTTNTKEEASAAKVSQEANLNQKPLTGTSTKVNPFRSSSQQVLCENVQRIVPLPTATTTTTTTTSTDESSTAKSSNGINLNQKSVVDISKSYHDIPLSARDPPPPQHGLGQNIQNSHQTQSPQMMPSFSLDTSPETIECIKNFLSLYEAQRATTSTLNVAPTQPQEKEVLVPDLEGKSQSSGDFSAIPI